MVCAMRIRAKKEAVSAFVWAPIATTRLLNPIICSMCFNI